MLLTSLVSLLLALSIGPWQASAVKSHDFKTCSQSGFCRRGRALADRAHESKNWNSPYSLEASTIQLSSGNSAFSAAVLSSLYPDVKFRLDVSILQDGAIRIKIDEVDGLRKRYDEAASWALISEPTLSSSIEWTKGANDIRAKYGQKGEIEARISYIPLRIALLRNGKEEVVINGDGLLHIEHFRKKPEPPPEPSTSSEESTAEAEATHSVEDTPQVVMEQTTKPPRPQEWFEGEKEDDWWEEQFSTWKDTKPKGPESFSLDVNFPTHGHVYGIPQHATRLALPSTRGESPSFEEPYRLYNGDVFEYLAASPMSLYGSIPLLHAHSATSTVGFFNLVGSETWIDVSYPSVTATKTHWISESGVIDFFILPGPTPEDVFSQYARLTGAPSLPPKWSLGYHQCRWNYVSSEDVRSVQRRFDEEDMPFDVLWLDIEYAADHRYFMWNEKTFPDPIEMVNDVAALGRKMVVIVDPHVKRADDYPIYKKATDLSVFVKDPTGKSDYEGWCWPGSSSWVDFFNPKAWDWWKSLYKIGGSDKEWHWSKSTEDIHIWNDMNEPSVFNGPEITMPKDNIHHGGWEHRDVHNINGMLYQNATYQALLARSNPPKRPFVLTRSFFSGSQRFGAMWTGDNMGTWEHMAIGVPMVLSNGIAGMTFSGADVGGFFGNPEPEMLVRWYQVGIFAPFFRAHAHIDTKRREPYLLDEPYKGIVKKFLKLRYSMLPVWYTLFREASVSGVPILRPHYVVVPKDKNGFGIDDQYFIGPGLLVKPVVAAGVTEIDIYLPEDRPYYNYFTNYIYRGAASGKNITVSAKLEEIALFRRGGYITATQERPRRSSTLMKNDPYTLTVALSRTSGAIGELYIDDGDSYSHEEGHLIWRGFVAKVDNKSGGLTLASVDLAYKNPANTVYGTDLVEYSAENPFSKTIDKVRVEKIVILGYTSKPREVRTAEGKQLQWSWGAGETSKGKKEGVASVLTIKNPGLLITKSWGIVVLP